MKLRRDTEAWIREVSEGYELESFQLRLLQMAAEAWDRSREAREALEQHGLTFVDRYGQPRARPEVQIENQARITFARLMRELALDVEPPGYSGRPPGGRKPGEGRPPALGANRGRRKHAP